MKDIAGKWIKNVRKVCRVLKNSILRFLKNPGFPAGNLANLYCRLGRTLVIIRCYIFKITGHLFKKIAEIHDKF